MRTGFKDVKSRECEDQGTTPLSTLGCCALNPRVVLWAKLTNSPYPAWHIQGVSNQIHASRASTKTRIFEVEDEDEGEDEFQEFRG